MTNWKIIGFFFAGTLVLLLLLGWQGKALSTPHAPLGIVSLELSCSAYTTGAIAEEWRPSLLSTVRWNILLDFFAIPFYGLFLYSLCGYFSVHHTIRILQRAGVLMAFGSLIAMLFDVCENILMIVSTHLAVTTIGSVLTTAFAVLKFSLIILSVLYILFSAIYMLWTKRLFSI